MRARLDGKREPCSYCGFVTSFLTDLHGPRGAVRTVAACVACGESPSRRAEHEARKKAAA